MSRSNVLKSIRDTVHGFVYLTPIEQYVVDRPEFQRLRFVFQQSVAYLTYPSNTTTRFAHSLGAAHLAGQMLICAVSNATEKDRDDFLAATRTLIADLRTSLDVREDSSKHDDFQAGVHQMIGIPFSTHAHPPTSSYPKQHKKSKKDNFAEVAGGLSDEVCMAVLWQAIRLATLVHDLGHLPMSHLFEEALGEYAREIPQNTKHPREQLNQKYLSVFSDIPVISRKIGDREYGYLEVSAPPHEQIGALLFKYIPEPVHFPRAVERVVSTIAKSIVVAVPPVFHNEKPQVPSAVAVIRFLHTVIAGQLDADRLDYSLRDPLAAGVEFGAINVTRLVRSQRMFQGTVDGQFRICVDKRALPDIEFFFIQRFFAFRQIVSQHNVARASAILRRILMDLMFLGANSDERYARLMEDWGFWRRGKLQLLDFGDPGAHGQTTNFRQYDDAWLRSFFRAISNLSPLHGDADAPDMTDRSSRVPFLASVLLNREIQYCWSLIKCEADYQVLQRQLSVAIRRVLKHLLRHRSKSRPRPPKWLTKIDIGDVAQRLSASTLRDDGSRHWIDQALVDAFKTAAEQQSVLAFVEYEVLRLPPKLQVDGTSIAIDCDDSIVPVEQCSSLISNLTMLRNEPARLKVFLVGPGVKAFKDSASELSNSVMNSLTTKVIDAIAIAAVNRYRSVGKNVFIESKIAASATRRRAVQKGLRGLRGVRTRRK